MGRDGKETISHKMPGGQRICLWMQREQEHITHSHVHAKDERLGRRAQREEEREREKKIENRLKENRVNEM